MEKLKSMEEIVKLLSANGNHPVNPDGFTLGKDGWICHMKKKIDCDLLSRYELPANVEVDPDTDSVYDFSDWSSIRGAKAKYC